MKKLELKTSKGEWLLVDLAGEDLDATVTHIYNTKVCSDILEVVCKLSEITEEQASEVVEMTWINDDINICKFKNYDINGNGSYNSPIESLHSLIKSLGVHLYENPEKMSYFNPEEYIQEEYDKFIEAAANTFYNPILFKKL